MRLSLLILLLVLPLFSMGQRSHIGVLGGAIASNFTSAPFFPQSEPILGTTVGFYYNRPVSTALSLESGFSLAQKGARHDPGLFFYSPVPSSSRLSLSYLSLPVLARVRLSDQVSIHGGGYLATLIHSYYFSTLKTTGETQEFTNWDIIEQNSAYARYDFGLQVGARCVFSEHLVINASYDHGIGRPFSRVFNDGPRNRSVSMSVGYQW